ncbi:MAG: hypothetical protein D6814_09840, partial [Calditrichaeota bacterium]
MRRALLNYANGAGVLGQLMLLVLTLGFSLTLGVMIIASRPSWWFASLFGILALILFMNHNIGVLMLFVSIFLIDWISEFLGLLPRQFTWLPEIILAILFAKIIFLKIVNKNILGSSIDKLMLLLICSAIIGAVVNAMNPIVAILGFRNFFKYIIMFYILLNLNLDEIFFKKMIKLLIIVALLQIPITIAEWQIYGIGDNVVGTLGRNTTGVMAIFLAFIASFLIGFYMHSGKILYLLMIVPLFIPIVL